MPTRRKRTLSLQNPTPPPPPIKKGSKLRSALRISVAPYTHEGGGAPNCLLTSYRWLYIQDTHFMLIYQRSHAIQRCPIHVPIVFTILKKHVCAS